MKGLKSVSQLKRFNKSALCVAVLVISSGLPVAAQTAFVRVNQVGYVGGGSKRAYLVSSGVEPGADVHRKEFRRRQRTHSAHRSEPGFVEPQLSECLCAGFFYCEHFGNLFDHGKRADCSVFPRFQNRHGRERVCHAAGQFAFLTTRTSAMARTSSPARCAQRLRT